MKNLMRKRSNEILLLGIFAVIFILMGIISPDRFLSMDNLQSMAFQMPEFGLITLGMMAIIVTGGINLSIVSGAMLSGIVSAYVLSSQLGKTSPMLAIIAAIIVCFLVSAMVGMLNGFVVAYIGVAPMLVTLGTMTFFEGVSLNFTKGGAVSGFPDAYYYVGNGSILSIPLPLIIYVIAVFTTYLLLERSAWGTKVYMTGCNSIATRFSGVNTKSTLMKVYIFSAMMGGVAALVMNSRYNSAKVDYGSSYLMQSISAVVLGGTSILGGHGTVMGTVIAVAIIQVISSGLNIIGINRYIVDISMGVVLITVLGVRYLSNYLNTKKAAKEQKAAA